ncbi:transcriptional regulator [Vibrio sp. 10N.286.49.C2]|uniref:glucitol operon DNA-binding transcriptional repressor SrlR n=1 Tax=unclassified Vibrio TaxID=2614977 RepID=UPI000C83C00B|nr:MULTISPECIES: DNA-binding transcriptional repressor [unclassified Vibrio]PMH33837.1 transcriptional regulator [Vibrio sp. 10N.286.49.C2]PMH44095.1 transcriptional regulator [Vibrio sp. 10N.286.49.B1]PMH83745.1 transcriptional regulator [Vibrio sp. 10N.286.48.B7]
MTIGDRRSRLVSYLQEHGKTAVNELAVIFETSGATIRTDLRQLELQGVVARRYGSAEACAPSEPTSIAEDIAMDDKKTINLDKKTRIARKAAELVQDGESIILDCGSTTLQMIPNLDKVMSLTLMTNSIDILSALNDLDSEHTVIMPGGTYRKKSASFHGSLAESAFSQFSFDKLFIGADGFDLLQGCTTYIEAYQVSQAMCQSANQIIAVLDSSKFGRKSPNVVVPIDLVDIVVTDTDIAKSDLEGLKSKGITVYLV